MSLNEKFISIRNAFYQIVETSFKNIAGYFGYPDNLGMPTIPDFTDSRARLYDRLPNYKTSWPPTQRPENWFEMIFGPSPQADPVPRYIYENQQEGFYNFYIENYKNIYFLPDWLSEFIQVKLNICLDITVLESIREVLFVGIAIYSQVVFCRLILAWLISVNPYTFPWYYLVALVDWTDEVTQGFSPSILGVNLTTSFFLGILGAIADSLNKLVFTMPFLPSEGEAMKLFINQEMKDVLVFHYLPILWYRYPIPNEIRKFWYNERPDIFNYMQKAYKDLDIQLLPDDISREILNQISSVIKLFSFHDFLI